MGEGWRRFCGGIHELGMHSCGLVRGSCVDDGMFGKGIRVHGAGITGGYRNLDTLLFFY